MQSAVDFHLRQSAKAFVEYNFVLLALLFIKTTKSRSKTTAQDTCSSATIGTPNRPCWKYETDWGKLDLRSGSMKTTCVRNIILLQRLRASTRSINSWWLFDHKYVAVATKSVYLLFLILFAAFLFVSWISVGRNGDGCWKGSRCAHLHVAEVQRQQQLSNRSGKNATNSLQLLL